MNILFGCFDSFVLAMALLPLFIASTVQLFSHVSHVAWLLLFFSLVRIFFVFFFRFSLLLIKLRPNWVNHHAVHASFISSKVSTHKFIYCWWWQIKYKTAKWSTACGIFCFFISSHLVFCLFRVRWNETAHFGNNETDFQFARLKWRLSVYASVWVRVCTVHECVCIHVRVSAILLSILCKIRKMLNRIELNVLHNNPNLVTFSR